jgi:hypothetical protein
LDFAWLVALGFPSQGGTSFCTFCCAERRRFPYAFFEKHNKLAGNDTTGKLRFIYKFHWAEWDQCYGGPSFPGSVTGVDRWVGTGIGVVGASVHVRPVSRFEFLTT